MKKLLIVVLLGVGVWLLYTRILTPPEERICSRVAELCGEGTSDELTWCMRLLGDIHRARGPEALKNMEDCVNEVTTCTAATSCNISTLPLQNVLRPPGQ